MPSLLTHFLAVLALLMTGCATQSVKRTPPIEDIPLVVGTEFQRSAEAWNAGDLNTFISIYADTATFALADELLSGRPAIRQFYAPTFAPGARRDELAFERLDVLVLSPDSALVRGIYRNSHLGQVTRRGTTTLVLRRIAGQWRIIHDHTN